MQISNQICDIILMAIIVLTVKNIFTVHTDDKHLQY